MSDIYKPEGGGSGKKFLVIFAALASLVGWAMIKKYKPVVLEAGCSEIAANSATLTMDSEIDPGVSYNKTKDRCLYDVR